MNPANYENLSQEMEAQAGALRQRALQESSTENRVCRLFMTRFSGSICSAMRWLLHLLPVVFVYVDDILVFFQEHEGHMRVLETTGEPTVCEGREV